MWTEETRVYNQDTMHSSIFSRQTLSPKGWAQKGLIGASFFVDESGASKKKSVITVKCWVVRTLTFGDIDERRSVQVARVVPCVVFESSMPFEVAHRCSGFGERTGEIVKQKCDSRWVQLSLAFWVCAFAAFSFCRCFRRHFEYCSTTLVWQHVREVRTSISTSFRHARRARHWVLYMCVHVSVLRFMNERKRNCYCRPNFNWSEQFYVLLVYMFDCSLKHCAKLILVVN